MARASALRWGVGPGALLLAALAAAGCAAAPFEVSPREEARLSRHYILAHEDGYPMRPDRTPLGAAEYTAHLDGMLDWIDARARAVASRRAAGPSSEPLRLLLFIHGGLNGTADDFRRMRQLFLDVAPEAPDGTRPLFQRTAYYPIFVNWNAALGDAIVDDLLFIRFGERVRGVAGRSLAWLTAPFVLAGRLVEAIVTAPTGWWAEYENLEEMAPGPGDYLEALALAPLHIVTGPVLKAFGSSAWHIMKRRADLVTAERLRRPPTDVRKGAAQVLIERLSARLTREVSGCTRAGEPVPVACWRTPERDGGRTEVPVEVTLVGHSMGAIIANRLLASPHDLPVRRIIYLAPASSLDEAELLLRRSLQRWSQVEFHGFALNRADEARERDPSGVLLPRGTLLVWIDALFEPVNTPARKRLGRIRAWLDYYEREAPPELTLREFAATSPGRPRRHGQLDDAVHLGRVLCLVDPRAFVDGCEDAGPDLRAVP